MRHRLLLGPRLLHHRTSRRGARARAKLERRALSSGLRRLHQHHIHLLTARSVHRQGELLRKPHVSRLEKATFMSK